MPELAWTAKNPQPEQNHSTAATLLSVLTATAIVTATDTTRPAWRANIKVAIPGDDAMNRMRK